jgi:serine/threonine-protein kinase
MDSLESKVVSGTEGAVNPFFSPDGQWLGFFSGGKLQKIPLSGGAAVSLADVTFPKGASWSSEGIIAFTPITGASAMMQVKDSGGAPQPLTRRANGQGSHRWPDFLPGGRALVFAAGSNALTFRTAKIIAQSLSTGEQHDLIQGGGTLPRYALSGHLIYARGGSLMAVPFDPERLAVTGSAVPVADGVLQSPVFGVAQYGLSQTGTLVYVPGGVESAHLRLMWVSRNGVEQALPAPAQAYFAPRLSPDGQRVAVGINEEESETWLYDLSRETLTRFTFGGDSNVNPTWTPDGKRIAFSSANGGALNLFWQLADGSGGLERLTTGAYTQVPLSFSPDGQFLAYFEVNPATQRDIWVLRMGDRKVQPFLQTPYDEAVPRFSPDGHWLAYISNESGRYEIYVQPFPGPGGKWQISTEGGEEPAWNPKGGELFYRSGDKMMAVDISTQPAFAVGKPRMLFEGKYEHAAVPSTDYAVSADGQRFLMLKPVDQAQSAPTQIVVVLNWFEELKQKVPTGKK